MLKIKKAFQSDLFFFILIALCAVVLRSIPQIKAGVWTIGYDTSNTYAAEIASFSGPLWHWLSTANILYFLFLPFKVIGMQADSIVKAFGPVIFTFLNLAFYLFARRSLKFNPLKSFLLVLVLLLQLASLRLSWDLYRNELSLGFMFLGLIYLPEIDKIKNLFKLLFFAILVVISNQLVTVLLVVILLVYWLYHLIKGQWKNLVATSIVLISVGALFMLVISSSGQMLYNSHVYFTSEKNYFWRYFYRYDQVMSFNLLKQNINSLFWLLYAWLIPPAVIGLYAQRKNLILWAMTIFLFFGTFSSLIFSGSGLFVWERWLFMLVFPLTIYAIEGIYLLGNLISRPGKWAKKTPAVAMGLATVIWVLIAGVFLQKAWPFLTSEYKNAKPPLANDELNSYFPRTMVHNSIGIENMKTTLDCVKWLDLNAPSGSVILVDNRYRGLMITNFNIDNRYIITNSWSESIQSSTLEAAKKTSFRPIYLIWNTSKAIDGFDRVYNSGNRGIYLALPSFFNPTDEKSSYKNMD